MRHANKPPVLLVDDESEILFSLKELLRREFELYTAESGRAALEILRQHPPHVVMTDQRMPEMTGVQLLRQVKEVSPQTVRMLFTGYADIKAVIEGINEVGLYRYLTKPWDPDELTQVLRQAATQYERAAEQQQLLADLRAYLRQEQAQRAAAPGAGPAAEGHDQLARSAGPLLERLERAVPS
jgi:response regulator RpfG family c-di-GMP phosphodiesterase